MRRLALAAAAATLVLASSASAAPLKTKTARSGPVSASISWTTTSLHAANHTRLRIVRDGRTAFTHRFRLTSDTPTALRVRDLDADGEREVIADFYTLGAHCCSYSLVYRYRGGTYTSSKRMWGNALYRLRDLRRDGVLEFVSSDDRFAYAFAPYAGSAFPIQIWRYRAGRMLDVTRSFPALVRRDAASWWKFYRREGRSAARGLLAGWLADQYLLGRQAQAWATMRRLNRAGVFRKEGCCDSWPGGRRYLVALRKHLAKLGYAA